jgi:hypothetical protein
MIETLYYCSYVFPFASFPKVMVKLTHINRAKSPQNRDFFDFSRHESGQSGDYPRHFPAMLLVGKQWESQ